MVQISATNSRTTSFRVAGLLEVLTIRLGKRGLRRMPGRPVRNAWKDVHTEHFIHSRHIGKASFVLAMTEYDEGM